ncbi:hypothetical protein E0485_19400 [Paenibacillus albiflavus]|uniref:Lipoprotein n=1 Tax=Paenibacillus albiflavus TaxID=2545760 RepID=A0A4R4E958_9BACL|nr:hypothetical protein [Paenibacillus albiflavus]TCZ74631.1 hypothetical protein E0485_19400 [Paenibacillus albiflavus]
MKLKTITVLMLLFSVLLSGCGEGKFKPDTMSKDDIAIMKIDDKNAKIYYGMKRSEAEKILGNGNKDILIKYDFGVEIMYRVNKENNEETVALISLDEGSKKIYSTIRGIKVGDLKSDVIKSYGEKYPVPTMKIDRDIAYYYDLKLKKFMGQESLANPLSNKDDLYEQIGTDFIFNDNGYVDRIMLYDRHMAIFFQ